MRTLVLALLVALFSTSVTAATDNSGRRSERIYAFKIGHWDGGAYRFPSTGKFAHCAITARYRTGVALSLVLTDRYEVALQLQNREWQIPENRAYGLRIDIDGTDYGKYTALPSAKDQIFVLLGARDAIFRALQHGSVLRVQASQRLFRFKLDGTRQALQRVRECVDLANTLAGTSTNPFEGDAKGGARPRARKAPDPENPFATRKGRKSKKTSWKDVVSPLLQAAGFTGVTFVDPSRAEFSAAEVAWRADENIFGMLLRTKAGGTTIEQNVNDVATAVGEECKGNFALSGRPTVSTRSGSVKEIHSACSYSGGELHIFATAVQRESLVVFLHITDERDAEVAGRANSKLHDIIVEIIN